MTKQEIRKVTIQEIFDNSGLKEKGYKYLKLKACFDRHSSDFTFSIGFGSTKMNMLDNTNIVIVTASVINNKYAGWQKSKFGTYSSGLIGAGKIKNLFKAGPPYYDFDLTENEDVRKKVLGEISSILISDVLFFFELCSDTKKLLDNVNLPCFSISSIIEYFEFENLQTYIPLAIEKKSTLYPDLKKNIEYYTDFLSKNTKPVGGFKETFNDNFNIIFSNGHLYRAGQSMNSLPSQILERWM